MLSRFSSLISSARAGQRMFSAWLPRLGAEIPDFECETTEGTYSFHSFLTSDPSRPWTVLFSHPADFTPVCTTELGKMDRLVREGEFDRRGVKVIGISCDSVKDHLDWSRDVLDRENRLDGSFPDVSRLSYPLIADPSRSIVDKLGMLDPVAKDAEGIPLPARAMMVVGADKRLKLSVLYPATTGRNYTELLRSLDSLQLTSQHSLATPVDWKKGERLIVAPSVPTEEARQKFQNLQIENLPSKKEYLRFVDEP